MSSDGDREMLGARVPSELKKLVDADERSNQDVVEAALWREFGGQKLGSLDRRIEEQKQYVAMKESQYNERGRELDEAEKELEALLAKRERIEEKQDEKKEDLYSKVRMVPRDPENQVVQQVAEDLDMEPEIVLKEAYDE